MKKTNLKTLLAVAALALTTMFSIQSAFCANPDKKGKNEPTRPNEVLIGKNIISIVSAYYELPTSGTSRLLFYLEDGQQVTFEGDSVDINGTYHLDNARSEESHIRILVRTLPYSPVEADYTVVHNGINFEVTMKGTTKKGDKVEFYYNGAPVNMEKPNASGWLGRGKDKFKFAHGTVAFDKHKFHYTLTSADRQGTIRLIGSTPIVKKEYDLSKDTTLLMEIPDPKNPNAYFKINNGLLKVKRSGDNFTINYLGQTPLGEVEFLYKGSFIIYGAFEIEYGKGEINYTEPPYQKGKEVIMPQYRIKAQ